MAFSAALRCTFALGIVLSSGGGAVQAQSERGQRYFEIKWQSEILPRPGETFATDRIRLRLLRNPDRVAFALGVNGPDGKVRHSASVGMLLLTLGGDGAVVHRTLVASDPAGAREPQAWHEAIALPDGDFLVQLTAKREQVAMELRRYSAEGALRFANVEPLLPDNQSLLLDATLLPDGRLVAIGADGEPPPSIFWLYLLGADGQRHGEIRIENLTMATEGPTRLFLTRRPRTSAMTEGAGQSHVSVLSNGMILDTNAEAAIEAWHRTFVLSKRAVVAGNALRLAPNAIIKCGAMAADGSALLVTADDSVYRDNGVSMRWLDADLRRRRLRTFEDVEACHVMLRPDGRVLAWLAPRRLVSLDKDAKDIWRATFDADALAVEALPDGDIVALHPDGRGIRVVRYVVR